MDRASEPPILVNDPRQLKHGVPINRDPQTLTKKWAFLTEGKSRS